MGEWTLLDVLSRLQISPLRFAPVEMTKGRVENGGMNSAGRAEPNGDLATALWSR